MAGNGKGLAAIALIIGLVGMAAGGYAAYDTFFGPEPEIPEQNPVPEINSYYYDNNFFSPIGTGNENITGPGISLNVTQNSTMYISFNCYVYHTGASMTEARVYINDSPVSGYIRVSTATTTTTRTPMTIQYYEELIEPGIYDIDIVGAAGAGPSTTLYTITLYVETVSIIE
jgi:hypothetical protein